MKKKMLYSVLLVTTFLLASCSGGKSEESKTSEDDSHYPVEVKNFTKEEGSTEWKSVEQKYTAKPKKVLANTRPAAELLLHLGLKDQIAGVGAVFGEADKSVEKEFDELNQLSTEYISKETALSVDPDLIYGRGGLFDNAEWGVGTVSSLNEMGIPTYVLESSTSKGTFNSVYKDIENLGNIFNVEEKAKEFSDEIKERQTKLEDQLKGIKEKKTFAYLHTDDPSNLYVYSLADNSFSLSIFDMVKLEHVFTETGGEISLETLIEKDPDVFIIPSFDGFKGEDSKSAKVVESIYSNPKLSSMKAVKNKEIYIMDYNYMFGYGYQSLDGVELLASEMYPDLFEK